MPPRNVALSLTGQGVMRLSPRLRESYLTADDEGDRCVAQAAGTVVHVWIPSDRQSIRLDLQTDGWWATCPHQRRLHRWGVNINRFLADANNDYNGIVPDSSGHKPTVDVSVTPIDVEVSLDADR